MLTIDFFLYNMVQVMIIERQLNSICEAASLTGMAILSKMDVSNDDSKHSKLLKAQKIAYHCAENMILRSHILNNSLNRERAVAVAEGSDLEMNLRPNECRYMIKLNNSGKNNNSDDSSARTVSCSMVYGFNPLFLGLSESFSYPVRGQARGGLPQIDSIVVLDLSASMDDQTVVTFVRREWIHSQLGMGSFAMGSLVSNEFRSGASGIIQYVSLACPSSPHTIANYLGWNASLGKERSSTEIADGSLVNILPPQNLDKANNEPSGAIIHPMYFDAFLRSHYSHYDGRSNFASWEAAPPPYNRALDYATPPGNCDLSVGLGGNGDAVTNMTGLLATPLGPRVLPGTKASVSNNPNNFMNMVPASPVPSINAFTDLTWQKDDNNYFGYQPAAPGAVRGIAQNDPIPSPDQQTFTDLVVNIVNPDTVNGSRTNNNIDGGVSYNQPLIGPDKFMGFSYTFPADDPDPLLRGSTFEFPNIAVVVEAARGNLENTPVFSNGIKNAQAALIDRPVSIDGTIFDMRSIILKDGYQRAYQRLAMLVTQPLASVLAAIDYGYFQKLHKFADNRFGLVAFSSAGSLSGLNHGLTFGTLNDKSASLSNERSFYIFCSPYGNATLSNPVFDCGLPISSGLNNQLVQDGSGYGFRIPRIPLNFNAENYMECTSRNKLKQPGISGETINIRLNEGIGSNGIYNCRAQSLTDSGEALQAAYDMFHSNDYDLNNTGKSRRSANKLIVFFTDGEPTGGINGKEAEAMPESGWGPYRR